MTTPRLRGTRCVLRSLRDEDARSLAAAANDREIWRQLRDVFPHPYSEQDASSFIAHVAQSSASRTLGIVVDDESVGVIGIEPQRDVNRCSGELGYWLARRHWGRGIVTEAIELITRWTLEDSDLERIFALPFSDNTGSRRALEKAGYLLEGTSRSSAIKDGVIKDQCVYAYLRRTGS